MAISSDYLVINSLHYPYSALTMLIYCELYRRVRSL